MIGVGIGVGIDDTASSQIGIPLGYSRSVIGGIAVTYMGFAVYDNGSNVIYL